MLEFRFFEQQLETWDEHSEPRTPPLPFLQSWECISMYTENVHWLRISRLETANDVLGFGGFLRWLPRPSGGGNGGGVWGLSVGYPFFLVSGGLKWEPRQKPKPFWSLGGVQPKKKRTCRKPWCLRCFSKTGPLKVTSPRAPLAEKRHPYKDLVPLAGVGVDAGRTTGRTTGSTADGQGLRRVFRAAQAYPKKRTVLGYFSLTLIFIWLLLSGVVKVRNWAGFSFPLTHLGGDFDGGKQMGYSPTNFTNMELTGRFSPLTIDIFQGLPPKKKTSVAICGVPHLPPP